MKPFIENSNLDELEAIQKYMEENGISDPEQLTEEDYRLISEAEVSEDTLRKDLTKTFSHMLKYKYQPTAQRNSWLSTISRGCKDINEFFNDNDKVYKFNNKYNSEEDFIELIYTKAVHDETMLNDTGMEAGDFPKTAKEAFGNCSKLKNLSNWNYMKDHFVAPCAIHDMKDDMIEGWGRYKW